jgi:S1-C subfamily serine protease
MNIQELHDRCIYPAVRVRTEKAGGSGTIIYSKEGKDGFDTFILTNHHVIESCIGIKDDWDSLLKKNIKKEFLSEMVVEVFDYVECSKVNSANALKGQIIAYDKYHDLAILKLISPKRADFVAQLMPKDKIRENIYIGIDVLAVGCSLLHDPVISYGKITAMREIIDDRAYLMTSCHIIFGNSGGALFLERTGELLGVPSRVTVIPIGFGADILTWMSFPSHPLRLYEFFEEQQLQFLYDPNETFDGCCKRRERKKKAAMAEMLRVAREEAEEED